VSIAFLRPDWPAPANVRAAFSWREGGVSLPPCDAFNLALHVGDDPGAVAANRAALRTALQLPHEPQWLQQVHGNEVLDLEAPLATTVPPVADAAVTRVAGLPLAIMVADCLPVLLASRDGRVIGAAHAGWRGLASGVIEATVRAMAPPGTELCAWLGPCIRQPQFEVGADVRAAFIAASGPAGSDEHAATLAAFAANARGRWQCDLAALARLRLRRAGVGVIADCGICTHADRARCFSHRRDGRTGRMAALLWLQA
jgi:YfiH family protein